jgi:hypothetical protein
MLKRSRKPKTEDLDETAFRVVKEANSRDEHEPNQDAISRVMALMGRKGGLKGGKRRLVTMTPEERRESAFKAARARWSKAKKRKR